jgi:hypothetical protein
MVWWTDVADVRRLQMTIDLRMPHLAGDHLFPDWSSIVTKLRAAIVGLKNS